LWLRFARPRHETATNANNKWHVAFAPANKSISQSFNKSILSLLLPFIFTTLHLRAQVVTSNQPTTPDTPVADAAARSRASEFAEGITRDGYTLRDGAVLRAIDSTRPLLIEVNLFAGNHYWFCAAIPSPTDKLSITVLDEKHQPLDTLIYASGSTVAAGITPRTSGRHFIRIALEGDEKTRVCFLYLYK